jgi:hypothetical protein
MSYEPPQEGALAEPDAVASYVRFDERRWEQGDGQLDPATARSQSQSMVMACVQDPARPHHIGWSEASAASALLFTKGKRVLTRLLRVTRRRANWRGAVHRRHREEKKSRAKGKS